MSAQKYRGIYQDGSAARNFYTATPVPDEFFEEDSETKKQRQLLIRKKRVKAVAMQRAAAKRKKRAIIGICAGVAVIVSICCIHLASRGVVARQTVEADRLREELTELTKKNEALEAEIEGSIDYDAIKYTAENEYGMIKPADGQIITYSADNEGYVKQFKDM